MVTSNAVAVGHLSALRLIDAGNRNRAGPAAIQLNIGQTVHLAENSRDIVTVRPRCLGPIAIVVEHVSYCPAIRILLLQVNDTVVTFDKLEL